MVFRSSPPTISSSDPGIHQDRQDLVQQGLPPFPGRSPGRQLVPHLDTRPALPRGDGLVEQADDLIQHIGGGLRQHRQQDRMPPLGLAPVQRLRGQPTPDRRQEPAPLRGQAGQVQRVGVQAAQESQLVQLGLHRVRRVPGRAFGQPVQPCRPDQRVHHQQPVELAH
jgi:hypothetical protein